MKKIVLLLIFAALISNNVFAYNEYNSTNNSNSYYQSNNDGYYCTPPKTTFWEKLKNSFIGEPTGYTPQIEDSEYIKSFGPSYMQGYFGPGGWNNHNTYNPVYSTAGVNILN